MMLLQTVSTPFSSPSFQIFFLDLLFFAKIVGQKQVIMIYLLFTVFGVTLNGSLLLVIALTLTQGVCGMSFGMLISAVSDTEQVSQF